MDIVDKIELFVGESDSNTDVAVMANVITNGRSGRNLFGKKKKKGTGDSQEEAPK